MDFERASLAPAGPGAVAPRTPTRPAGRSVKTAWLWAAVVGLVALWAGLLLALSLFTPINHDEQQYAAASAELARRLLIYRDFQYFQTPLHPMIVALFDGLVPDRELLKGRLLALVSAGLLVFSTFKLLRRSGAAGAPAALLTASLFGSAILVASATTARNDLLPFALTISAIGLLEAAVPQTGRSRVYAFLGGVCAGLAVSDKLTYLGVPVCLLAYGYGWVRQGRRADALFLSLGMAAGGVPILASLLLAPDQFVFNIYTFHKVATPFWYAKAKAGRTLDPIHKLVDIVRFLVSSPGVVVALVSVAAALFLPALRTPEARRTARPLAAVLAVSLAVSLVGFAPTPTIPAYWLAASAGATIAACLLASFLLARSPGAWFGACIAGGLALGVGYETWVSVRTLASSHCVVCAVAETSTSIRDAVRRAPGSGKIATLAPIQVLEAGGRIVPRLAAGPFFYRAGEAFSPADQGRFAGAGPGTLAALLDAEHVSGVLVGIERPWTSGGIDLEQGLVQYALARNMHIAPNVRGGTLYVSHLEARTAFR